MSVRSLIVTSSVVIVDFLPNEDRNLKPELIIVLIFSEVDEIALGY